MSIQQLASQIAQLRKEFTLLIASKARDQYERAAFQKIEELLDTMERECQSEMLRPKPQRYPYIARLAAESDPQILPPEFGGKLIKIENLYREI